MPDSATPGTGDAAGQAPNATQGQAPTTTSDQASGAAGQAAAATSSTETVDSQATLALLTRERDEARREAAKLRTAAKTAAEAQMTELERAQARVAELERVDAERASRERDRSVRLAAVEEANKLGFRSPDLAYRLIDRGEVDFSDDGEPRNVAKLLKAIAERDPYLLKGNGADFGGGNRGPAPQPNSMDEMIRAKARGLPVS